MYPSPAPSPHPPTDPRRPYRIALLVTVTVAAVLAYTTVGLYTSLTGIPACDGGLMSPGPDCSDPPYSLAQLGYVQHVNGSYEASVILTPSLWSTVEANQIVVSISNDTGASLAVSSVVVDSPQGLRLANYTLSGDNWTTTQPLVIFNSVLFEVASPTNLSGAVFFASDPSAGWGIPAQLS